MKYYAVYSQYSNEEDAFLHGYASSEGAARMHAAEIKLFAKKGIVVWIEEVDEEQK